MLSYRHAFHAGNFADVLKHWVQVEILLHLRQKDKPFIYVDTHAGAGLYALDSSEAHKTSEYLNGIGKLQELPWPELVDYLACVESLSARANQKNLYPGSPAIAQSLLREQDKAELFELHPNDFERLAELVRGDRRIKTYKQDGFSGLLSKLPPLIKRGLVLIDPSYEIKSDYQTVVDVVCKAYKKFPTATYAVWYPVVERSRIDALEQAFQCSEIKDVHLFELGMTADTDGRGMTSAGMIVINPPWTLASKLQQLLPRLAQQLSAHGVWRCRELVPE